MSSCKGQTARHMLTLRENSAWNEMDVEPIMQPWRTGGMEMKGSYEDIVRLQRNRFVARKERLQKLERAIGE